MTEHEYACEKLAEQKQRIHHLEREADWLAHKLTQEAGIGHLTWTAETWREAARKAVSDV